MGRDECGHRQAVGRQRAPRVEPEPSDPQQSRAGDGHRQVMRWHRLAQVAAALADHQRGRECGDARRDMNYRAAGKIERAHLMNPSVDAPYPVRQRIVNQSNPEDAENQETLEGHSLRDRAGDKCGRDHGKHALVNHVRLMRHGRRIGGIRLCGANATESCPRKCADQAAAGRERETVAEQHPLNRHDRDQDKALHQRR